MQYVERDTTSPPPVIGVASCVPIGRSSEISATIGVHEKEAEVERDYIGIAIGEGADLENTSDLKPRPLSISKKRKGVVSPALSSFLSLPNITIGKNRKSAFKALPRLKTSPDVNKYQEYHDDEEEEHNGDNTPTLSVSESEWMCRTPSPIPDHSRFSKLWSPGDDKQRKSIQAGGSLRKKAMNWYGSVKNSAESEDTSSSLGEGEARVRDGENWI